MSFVITIQSELENFIDRIEGASFVAVDTEADSLYAYPERLCLLQIAIPGEVKLIDPFARFMDLTPLIQELRNHEIILHGADFDLRLLHRTTGFIPSAIFDTMIAARLTGERAFGLKLLVEKHLGVKLSKSLRKANWAQRPLSERMIEYAKADTRYLHPLATLLTETLEAQGRRDWNRESCERLIEECSRDPVVDEDSVWRLKGADRLERRGLAVLRELWHWRETEALKANRPPFFVVSHEHLVDLAYNAQRLPPERLRLPRKMSRTRVKSLRNAVKRALSIPENSWPSPKPARKRVPKPRADATKLAKARDAIASELDIDPTLIANKETLERLAYDWDAVSPELMRWQRELLLRARANAPGGE